MFFEMFDVVLLSVFTHIRGIFQNFHYGGSLYTSNPKKRNRKKHPYNLLRKFGIIEQKFMLIFPCFTTSMYKIDGAQICLRADHTTVIKRAQLNNFIYLIVNLVYLKCRKCGKLQVARDICSFDYFDC